MCCVLAVCGGRTIALSFSTTDVITTSIRSIILDALFFSDCMAGTIFISHHRPAFFSPPPRVHRND